MIRLGVLAAALSAACAGFVLLARDQASPGTTPAPPPATTSVSDPLAPAPELGLEIPTPVLLSGREDVSLWAPVLEPVAVRRSPSAAAPPIGRLAERTPEGTTNIVLVTGDGRRAGLLWVPIRGAGLEGWVPRRALGGYASVDTRLQIDTQALTATLLRGADVVFQAPVGIGTIEAPTPTGEFFVRNVLTRYASAAYGPIAFGTSARSETLTDWPAGGFVGIHGTDRPDLLPGRVSHGCIRLRNPDIVTLARLMPVGTPVRIT